MCLWEGVYFTAVLILALVAIGILGFRYASLFTSVRREGYFVAAIATVPAVADALIGLPILVQAKVSQTYFYFFEVLAIAAVIMFCGTIKWLLDVREKYQVARENYQEDLRKTGKVQ